MRRIRLLAAMSAGLALTAAVTPVSARPGGPPDATARPAGVPAGAATATVHLVTGDRVTVSTAADGRRAAAVEPGPGRRGVVFRTLEQDGRITVLPSDAAGLVAAGRLDRSLFDVTGLIAQGYDDARTDVLPLIVADGTGEASAERLADLAADGTGTGARLASIGARPLAVERGDLGALWKRLVPEGGGSVARRAAATPRVWLDGRVGAVLDRSTAQIGTPAVWEKGYRGEGVKVAVLDTGVDQGHPDLAGRVAEAKDFSGSSGTGDAFGHGTHVASIVGGSGAASDGRRKGVAPRADLLVGKVLGDDGYGSESQVIAGMEWAAARGAKVINMSLGSDQPTDGTDPMSLALNELSARTGTLFVVAAGNSGEAGPRTVGSPGAADAALTVGAVDRDDRLASFSSRGPRFGDGAVKPDVTAPGVGIVAARAAGTSMGDVVDEHYVAASGTSMATPHVAGAAALIAQRHPDWDGARLKDALVSTARTAADQKTTEQGAGRIDVAAALGDVTATGGVHLGTFETGAAGGGRTVRYTNTSDRAVDLFLTLRLATESGTPAPAGAVRPGVASVRVPAGASADVPVAVDPSAVPRGRYYGHLTATDSGGTVRAHTTLALVVHGPVHRLTVRAYGVDGERAQVLPTLWGPDGFVEYTDPAAGVAEVEEGTYQLSASFAVTDEDVQELREVILPEVRVTRDTTVTADARRTVPVTIRTPRPAEQRGVMSYQSYREIDGRSLLQGTLYFDNAKRLYVSPTAKVTEGTFEFASRWQLVAPLLTAAVAGTDDTLNAYYMPTSPLLGDRGATLTAADAGDVSAPDLRRVRDRIAVLTNVGNEPEEAAVARAKAAGAKAVLLVFEFDNSWTRWTPVGDRAALPTIRVGARAGARLLDRVHRRTTKVELRGTPRSPYLYDVMQVAKQRIPDRVEYTVSERTSAVTRTTYTDTSGTGGGGWLSEQRFGWRPQQRTAWNQYTRYAPAGFERTEYVSGGDTTWQHLVHHETTADVDVPLAQGLRDTPRRLAPGRTADESWHRAVVRPSIPAGTADPSTRQGDVLRLRVPEFTDAQAGHQARLSASDDGGVGTSGTARTGGDAASATLYRDGRRLQDLGTAWADVELPGGTADYRLDLTTSRTSDTWAYAPRTETSWTFRSGTTAAETLLPLLQIDYAVPVDATGRVRSRGAYGIGLTVRAQDGLSAPRGVTLRAEVSYDDGRTWRRADVRDRGGNAFRATVEPGRADAWVTLRVTARDTAGNGVRQTVERAFRQTR
ncbi:MULTISPECIES: S8 family serine peptidase [unclassified Streptomyces]|uniref:S8 family serine peptidase n=1 Tax=unclassified Streptomyces TaxID=2593676 RepID=UPI00380187EB